MFEVCTLIFILNLPPAAPDAVMLPVEMAWVEMAWVDETVKVTLPSLCRVGTPVQCSKTNGLGEAEQIRSSRNWPCWFG